MMKRSVILLFLLLTARCAVAQNEFKNILIDRADDKMIRDNDFLDHYAGGRYQTALKEIEGSEPVNIPHPELFKSYALLYGRDYEAIREEIDSENSFIPEAYQFYTEFPETTIEMSGDNVLPLNVTRFNAVIGNDTLVILLDTGGSGVGIDQEWVDKYDMPYDSSITTPGILPFIDNARFVKYPVMIPEIRIGNMTLRNLPAEFSSFSKSEQKKLDAVDLPEFDIIMGLDTFIGLIGEVEIDWMNDRIIFRKKPALTEGTPFLFYSSKPFTAIKVAGNYLTTVVDTGSPSDMVAKDYYMNNYTDKSSETYRQYEYQVYTVPLTLENGVQMSLKFKDYIDDIPPVIGDEQVELLLGFDHNKMVFNLEENLFYLL